MNTSDLKVASAFYEAIFVRNILARFRQSMEHASPQEMKQYLQNHPQALPKNHHVEEKDHTKGVFDAKEVSSLPDTISQKTKTPDKLFKEAKEAHEEQLTWLNHGKGLDKALGAKVIRADEGQKVDFSKPGPVIMIGPMKDKERSKEKVDADYGGDWSKLGDIVRASVAVDSMDQITDVMKKLRASGLKLARKPKDRFAKPTEAGYRDVIMNVEYPNGHVGELQLHLKGILKAKEAGHKLYEEVRTIEGNAKKEGRAELTDKELGSINEANRKMQDQYQQAWDKATGAHKTKNAAMPRSAAETKYFEYHDLPAYWEHKRFPVIVTTRGEKIHYDLEKFFRSATPISEHQFKKMKGAKK